MGWVAIEMWVSPRRARLMIWISSTVLSPMGSNGFGITCVNGLSREPSPPARMTAFISFDAPLHVVRADVCDRALPSEPLDRFLQPALERVHRRPAGRCNQARVVAEEAID